MNVKVCDMIMGAGKTESAITQMNEDEESKYIFVTPYLDEVKRIKDSCEKRKFSDPYNSGDGKLADLHRLLAQKSNIATTHALFETYNEETISLIRNGGYKLILDEVYQTTKAIEISPKDLKMLQGEKKITTVDGLRVRWNDDKYDGKFNELRDNCCTGNVILYKDSLLLWEYPIEVFEAFREVIILTYMFEAQVQKYYFDVNGVEIKYIGTKHENNEFRFSNEHCIPEYVTTLIDRVHILDDPNLNEIGDSRYSLSSSWFERAMKKRGKPQIEQLKKNIYNAFRNKFNSESGRIIWTVYKNYKDVVKGKGYTNGFLSCNVRATNAYRNRDCLAYCVNIFYNPLMKSYFADQGIEVREDKYALSEMIQWIWRSAIRDGKEIWIYVPSKRMRELLEGWLKELSERKAEH